MPKDELTPLSPNDADAGLARRIGEGQGLSSDDPFERALIAYRERLRDVVPPRGFSERLWAKIAPRSTREFSPLRLVPAWARWASAAAAVLLVAYAFWATRESGPMIVSSATDTIAAVVLEDGSSVTLRPHSTLYKRASNRYLLEGEAFFDVAHNPQRTFVVRTDRGDVRVLGTRFDVSTWGGETAVFLERGSVAFVHLATGIVDTLLPGEELMASRSGVTVGVAADDGEGALDWMNDALIFGARPLSRIVAEMEHHFGITVLVPDSLQTETLSGQIYLSSPKQSLRDLGTALGAPFEETKPNVFRLSEQ